MTATYEGRNRTRFGLRAFFERLRRRVETSRRPDLSTAGDNSGENDDDPGAAGAGRTAPLIPRTPLLSGSAARTLGEE